MDRRTNYMLEHVRNQLDELKAGEDINAYNTKLAKLFQRLKKDAGATSVKQNYKGTGSQKHRRQLWCRYKSGAVMDLWLDGDAVRFGGVVTNGGGTLSQKAVAYQDKTPEQVYAEASKVLNAWANSKKEDLDEATSDEKIRRKLILGIYKRINVSDKMIRAKKHKVQLVGSNAKSFGVGNYTMVSLEDQTTPDLQRLAGVVGAPAS